MPDTRDLVFDRVRVDCLTRGQTRVYWRLYRGFYAPGPFLFQLEVGQTGNPLADDWEAVGLEGSDNLYAVDDEPRDWTKGAGPYYRVRLIADGRTYYSNPEPAHGDLGKKFWLTARAVVRRERLHNRMASGWQGWLLKRKWVGETPDPTDLDVAVTDPMTGEIVNTRRTATHGTEFVDGYYAPIPLIVELDPQARYIDRDELQAEGTHNLMVTGGRVVGLIDIQHNDVFVHNGSDRRFIVHKVTELAHLDGVPLVCSLELRQAAATHPIYEVAV